MQRTCRAYFFLLNVGSSPDAEVENVVNRLVQLQLLFRIRYDINEAKTHSTVSYIVFTSVIILNVG